MFHKTNTPTPSRQPSQADAPTPQRTRSLTQQGEQRDQGPIQPTTTQLHAISAPRGDDAVRSIGEKFAMNSGAHRITWQAGGASGIYFYCLRLPPFEKGGVQEGMSKPLRCC